MTLWFAEEDGQEREDPSEEEKIDLFAAIDAGDLERLQVGGMHGARRAFWGHVR
jgi:hypothetical protein